MTFTDVDEIFTDERYLQGHNTQHRGHMGQHFKNELMVEIHSKSLVKTHTHWAINSCPR